MRVPHSLSCFPEPAGRVIPMWWAELWWPEFYSARTSGSNTHTLVTPSRGVGVAAAAIPVIRCRCAQSAAYHRFVCAAVGSLLHMYSTYVANTPHCLCLHSSVEYQLRCARLVCYADLLLRNYSLRELSLLRNSSASRTRCFAPAGRVTR